MKKILSVSSAILFLASLSITALAQVQPSLDHFNRPVVKATSDVSSGEEVRILPYPGDDSYRQEIARIRDLDLQSYAGEIADELIKQLSWEKAWRELDEKFWGDTGYNLDFTIPEKEEVIAAVYNVVQQLGGTPVPEAKVGIVADEIVGPVFTAILALGLTDVQRSLVGIPDSNSLTQDSIGVNVIQQIKNNVWQQYMEILYSPVEIMPLLSSEPAKTVSHVSK